MTTVACDVCGERYKVARSAFGRSQKCKVCLVPFDVCSHTVAPDETDEKADGEPDTSEFEMIQKAIGSGLTTLALVGCLGWMASLPFRDPRAVESKALLAPTQQPTQPKSLPIVVATRPAVSTTPNSPNNAVTNTVTPTPPAIEVRPAQASTAPKLERGTKVRVREGESLVEAEVVHVVQVKADQVIVVVRLLDRPALLHVRMDQIELASDQPAAGKSDVASSKPNRDPIVYRGVPINYNGPGSIAPSGRTVTSIQQLQVGQIVQVQWGATWYPADVNQIKNAATVRIHYRGWSDKWDEDVSLNKIQLAHDHTDRR